MKVLSKILSIDETELCLHISELISQDGQKQSVNITSTFQKVTADYSQDIVGLWEGVETTGKETYGDANHRIEFKTDGTYVYYDNDGDFWILSADADNEYYVDGDWLSSRWKSSAGADYDYECWDIDEIKDGIMKWSALRDAGDGSRFTTTFTWKKIQ